MLDTTTTRTTTTTTTTIDENGHLKKTTTVVLTEDVVTRETIYDGRGNKATTVMTTGKQTQAHKGKRKLPESSKLDGDCQSKTRQKYSRKPISMSLKARFIEDVEAARLKDPKTSVSSICRQEQYGFTPQAGNKILAEAKTILKEAERLGTNALTMFNKYNRRMDIVEQVLYLDFKNQLKLGLPVNDKRLLEMAFYTYMETMPLLRYKDRPAPYNFSPGWLANFKKRFNIRMHVGHGEEGDVDMVKNAPLFKAIADGLTGISPRDIYNCDETGLYLKALSNRTLSDTSVKGKKLIRGARVSILACCNADGTDKRPLFVLSAHRPQGLDEDTQAVMMTDFAGSGYMTQELFQEWLDVFDADMKEQGRKIVLLMDNAPGHGKLEQYHLTNITIVFLPPKTTSVAQPLDAGIIRSYKTKYTRHMIRVTANYRGSNGLQSTVVKYWPCLVKAWDDVTKTTIRNCFAHVPTIPPELRSELRTTQEDDIDKEMEQLKQELMKLYPAGDAAIQMQKDYGVLTYLKSCEGDGPTQGLMDAIKQVSRMEEYKDQFYSPEELTVVEEDQLDDESDPLDLDYFPSCAPRPCR
ncbi:hypothetical protein EMPS_03903 [Entomortierella parvispora]|uniref:HTH CENPB-type domain-containing protein n=1 Tax=Entomortierella parvispora TaxID=205924 RepID=A0A9P3H7N7_9FUNG|nr:hypothetical protein EMPS_03903 [Entomortierella parvispora]